MYLRTTPRRNSDGSVVRYLQLAHNLWDPQAKRSKVQVIYNLGREDANNRARCNAWSPRSHGSWTPTRRWPPPRARALRLSSRGRWVGLGC